MNEQNVSILKKAFPRIFKDSFYFECGDGWFELIGKTAAYIDTKTKDCQIVQVKEKFGSLRIYITFDYNQDGEPKVSEENLSEIYEFIRLTEQQSKQICEDCGKELNSITRESQKNLGYWIRNICKSCSEKYRNSKRNTEIKDGT
jgi:hypothetical protein